MAVKDLVNLFEQTPSSQCTTSPNRDASPMPPNAPSDGDAINEDSKTSSFINETLRPSPARFVTLSPSPQRRPATPYHDAPASIPLTTLHDQNLTTSDDSTTDTTSTLFPGHSISHSINRFSLSKSPATVSSQTTGSTLVQCIIPSKPDTVHLAKYEKLSGEDTLLPDGDTDTPTTVQPVSATIVFARGAAPLYLPNLDNYMSSLPVPVFSSFTKYTKEGPIANMFPPMDKLALTGKSIYDLEANFTIPPAWRNRTSIFGSLASLMMGVTGSSLVAGFYSLHGVFDTFQIFALILSSIIPSKNIGSKWKQLFLGTIPNILAFNFASTLTESIIFLIIFMLFAFALLYYFFVLTNKCQVDTMKEGHQPSTSTGSGWALLVTSFLLTVIYLPLSTLAVHAIIWSDDFWVVPNPYTNATTNPPVLPLIGPPSEFRAPLDFCYTTTMKLNEIDYAPVIVIISAITFVAITVWFPFRLRQVINSAAPKVDMFTELGKPRSKSDLDREYQRMLDRDRNPLSFLYRDYRRGWATYRSLYFFVKLSALLIVAIISPDNCWFRSFTHTYVSVTREIVLFCAMLGFLLLQCFLSPFVEPINNASEWTSRLNYCLTALVGLLVALNVPGQSIINGPILYIIYIITYGLGFYFTVVNWSWVHRLIKRLTNRIDFSIDIFSPKLDISISSRHVKRRIWQETVTTLFLTAPDCKIPSKQTMTYAEPPHYEYPPYLLNFQGSPAERHVENLKILREVGGNAYNCSIATISGSTATPFNRIQDVIQRHFIGPDSYWRPESPSSGKVIGSAFGNAWWIPFPPSLVLKYDDGPLVVLKEMKDLQTYVAQNSSLDVRRKREIRMALRALDGKLVQWPHRYEQPIGKTTGCFCCGPRYRGWRVVHFQAGLFEIGRKGQLQYKGVNLGSGFDVTLTYSKDVRLDGEVLGLNSDYDLTPELAHFLHLNRLLISTLLPRLDATIQSYRNSCLVETKRKTDVLSYSFLMSVYECPQTVSDLAHVSIKPEKDIRVRQLVTGNEEAFITAYERWTAVTSSRLATWWYIFWDDFWRRNYSTISALQTHATDFNPHYPTCIAYKPIPRAALETFLLGRGLMSSQAKPSDPLHSGFLNKMYLFMNEIAFHGSSQAIMFHVGDDTTEIDLEDLDLSSHARTSSLGTGGGTDHDDPSIRARPNYRWEGIFEDPLSTAKHRVPWTTKLAVWFGITPLWRVGYFSRGLSLDVTVQNGRYVQIPSKSKNGSPLKLLWMDSYS